MSSSHLGVLYLLIGAVGIPPQFFPWHFFLYLCDVCSRKRRKQQEGWWDNKQRQLQEESILKKPVLHLSFPILWCIPLYIYREMYFSTTPHFLGKCSSDAANTTSEIYDCGTGVDGWWIAMGVILAIMFLSLVGVMLLIWERARDQTLMYLEAARDLEVGDRRIQDSL